MKIYALTLIFLTSCLNTAGQNANNTKAMEAEISKMEKILIQAILKRDDAKLSEIFADDLAVNAPINRISTKADVLRLVRERRISYSAYEASIEHIEALGDAVIVMGSETVSPIDNSPFAGTVLKRRFTQIWTKQTGKWQLSVRHANVICPK